MITLGIDLAARPATTAACLIEWGEAGGAVSELRSGVTDEDLLGLCAAADRVGIDVPFGWPLPFVRAISAFAEGLKWPAASTQELRFRATDLHVQRAIGIWPLSVSTDRIGVTAMRAASLLSTLASWDVDVDRSGIGPVVEVYPAAALKLWGLPYRGYKRGDRAMPVRRQILDGILSASMARLDVSDAHHTRCLRSSDALDALLCSLIARASASGLVEPLPKDPLDRASREGWIALPVAGSLERLVAPDAHDSV